ncbi:MULTISPECIES: class I SAM-dependent methyltransferase [unclassified Paenibacillus]|uniref:tRNA (adenine(22)-N(1))-methyltransferase n=1 Tax=unclassified Paenibacillus TaxID=185978 RepID=UPI001AE95A3B|nr:MULTISPECIES: class I SAM-dependent methyltransferase [unclassified Paenibacillus]MBP1156316.1 tRNA (adenine22-N1)-methyltransferase [Paenibacillus sp. PvP091]MBP1168298.1 tRNA (adenine22-N1)-methyltransferase [Paenibacillus sp. PvR098]MBP2439326.1 tRNA (adenine22-N1)-methyltransferase [Paenibacillus sp. PvP052]
MVRLSKRLEMIAQEVPAGSRLADIGSDHALLPSFLSLQGTIVRGVAGEVNAGPFEAALKQVRSAGLDEIIEVRHGDGLQVISPGEVDVITIAGMGGALIASILEAGKSKLAGVRRLVLQPNVGESNVRQWLLENEWVLTGEHILEEDGKTYEILTAVPTELAPYSNVELYAPRPLTGGLVVDRERMLHMGPFLIREASQIWMDKWFSELDKLNRICERLSHSELSASRNKEAEFRREMDRIKEVLEQCMPKDKR